MGRCVGCKQSTQNFCYVHQDFLCGNCVVEDANNAQCVVGGYRDWVTNSSYVWPPRCVICGKEVGTKESSTRLVCLALAHDECLRTGVREDGNCPHCKMSLLPSPTDQSSLAKRVREVTNSFPWAQKLLPEATPPTERPDSVVVDFPAVSSATTATISGPVNGSHEEMEKETENNVAVSFGNSVDHIGYRKHGHVDDRWKTRKNLGKRQFASAQMYIRRHRRQLLLLAGLCLCVALSVIMIGNAIHDGLPHNLDNDIASAAFRQRTMSDQQRNRLLSKYAKPRRDFY